jgi:hypothetical protein
MDNGVSSFPTSSIFIHCPTILKSTCLGSYVVPFWIFYPFSIDLWNFITIHLLSNFCKFIHSNLFHFPQKFLLHKASYIYNIIITQITIIIHYVVPLYVYEWSFIHIHINSVKICRTRKIFFLILIPKNHKMILNN